MILAYYSMVNKAHESKMYRNNISKEGEFLLCDSVL
jgi:hypothetical protein